MAFATTIATNQLTGPSAGQAVSGSNQIAVFGNFKSTQSTDTVIVPVKAYFEISPNGGANWFPINGTELHNPGTYVLDLGTGAEIRLMIIGTAQAPGISAMLGALP